MSPIAVLFWVWLVVSTTIFIQRRITAHGAKAADLVSGPKPSPEEITERTPPWLAQPTVADGETATENAEHDHVSDPSMDDDHPRLDESTGSTPTTTSEPAETEPTDIDTPPPASGPLVTSAFKSSMQPTLGIADALSGIRMPCDLAPLTLGTGGLDPDHVDLVTTGVGPGEVAAGLTAELERLGYDVRDLGAGEHLADRDGTVVRVKVHDRPRVSVGTDGRGFPTAPENGIVVEMTLA